MLCGVVWGGLGPRHASHAPHAISRPKAVGFIHAFFDKFVQSQVVIAES